jgi:hypothetical protein
MKIYKKHNFVPAAAFLPKSPFFLDFLCIFIGILAYLGRRVGR